MRCARAARYSACGALRVVRCGAVRACDAARAFLGLVGAVRCAQLRVGRWMNQCGVVRCARAGAARAGSTCGATCGLHVRAPCAGSTRGLHVRLHVRAPLAGSTCGPGRAAAPCCAFFACLLCPLCACVPVILSALASPVCSIRRVRAGVPVCSCTACVLLPRLPLLSCLPACSTLCPSVACLLSRDAQGQVRGRSVGVGGMRGRWRALEDAGGRRGAGNALLVCVCV